MAGITQANESKTCHLGVRILIVALWKTDTKKWPASHFFQVHGPRKQRAMAVSLVDASFVITRLIPYRRLAWPNLPLYRDSIDLILTSQSGLDFKALCILRCFSSVADLTWDRITGCPISCNIEGCLWFDRCDRHAPDSGYTPNRRLYASTWSWRSRHSLKLSPTGSVYKGIATSTMLTDNLAPNSVSLAAFATFNRSHMRLTDAYDAVIDPAAALIVHQLLLAMNFVDDQKLSILFGAQHRQLNGF